MKIAFVSRNGEVQNAYNEFMKAHGAEPVHVLSISDLNYLLQDTAVCGFVLDIPTVVKATERERKMLQAMELIFPNIRTNWNSDSGFRALYYNSNKTGEDNFVAFLNNCRSFRARPLRREDRKSKNFNLLMWLDNESETKAQRAFTLDISRNGLFISTSDPHPVGSTVLIKMLELDECVLKVEVKWDSGWGKAMRIPGFGGKFVDMKSGQAARLENAFN